MRRNPARRKKTGALSEESRAAEWAWLEEQAGEAKRKQVRGPGYSRESKRSTRLLRFQAVGWIEDSSVLKA